MEDQQNNVTSEQNDAKDGVATELRIAREAKGYTLADLHRITGLSRTALHQYESGARKPGARELVLLCQALEVSPNRVLLGTEEPFLSAEGVLVPLVKLAKTNPGEALAIGALMIPMVAAILASIGNSTLMGLATLADETLRARDPETFSQLSKLVAEFKNINPEDCKGKSKEELQEIGRKAFINAGFAPEMLDQK